ncbi:MAG: hypothetical protein QM811_19940 [Pirellulales bacterium]
MHKWYTGREIEMRRMTTSTLGIPTFKRALNGVPDLGYARLTKLCRVKMMKVERIWTGVLSSPLVDEIVCVTRSLVIICGIGHLRKK